MVDVGAKPVVRRTASAAGTLICASATIRALKAAALSKGDVLATARIAGIQAAKKTADLIPLCHTLPLQAVSIDFTVRRDRIDVRSAVSTEAKTGVEMEALTAVSVACLTLYDMMKAADKTMRIENVRVVSKEKA